MKGAANICRCGQPVVERIVSNGGQNHGRRFFACSKQKDDGSCGHFEWADTDLPQPNKAIPKKRSAGDVVIWAARFAFLVSVLI